MLFSPSSVQAKVGDGTLVKITEKTDYPFTEDILFIVETETPVKFPFYIRIPSWCKNPVIIINTEMQEIDADNGLIRINRTWENADQVAVSFPMQVTLTKWYERSVAVERGPLVYALKMKENWTNKPFVGEDAKWHGTNYWEITFISLELCFDRCST